MKMVEYPMRERIYLPVCIWGVAHTEFKWVFLFSMAGFILPFIANIFGYGFVYGFPASTFIGPLALIATVTFFNITKRGRRPLWFQHKLKSLFSNHWHRQILPMDRVKLSWIK
jgi:hypothetical protein